jgi:hypothetical protein
MSAYGDDICEDGEVQDRLERKRRRGVGGFEADSVGNEVAISESDEAVKVKESHSSFTIFAKKVRELNDLYSLDYNKWIDKS